MNGNIYALSAPTADAFSDFCGGNAGGPHETCVSLAAIPGSEASFVIRDSKPEGAGKELRFTGSELDDFAAGWVRTRGLTL
ncbi:MULTISPECIES: DUF397 domain-containing protein [Streptomyces]|uniref:DUF397 domain-containing protein n=1 Tax=Streptomyces rubiginosohelvolus TaxID=67362 RepID=A0ABQ3C980_9ACTN|nr:MULTISPECIES: DUF397 domain-containing protein [Streptomyces]RUP67438.1 hypothetical protein SSPNP10_14860 [Streptomyces sp. NP10]GGS02607.1 hypothetical protein GCM10010284_39540 [Streptomyces rubiginosohelvolus]GGZ71551.1 hypothetical protein GCM10010328_53360 [Streptomyces pluricolorescens]